MKVIVSCSLFIIGYPILSIRKIVLENSLGLLYNKHVKYKSFSTIGSVSFPGLYFPGGGVGAPGMFHPGGLVLSWPYDS